MWWIAGVLLWLVVSVVVAFGLGWLINRNRG
jgi:hypothetical protein